MARTFPLLALLILAQLGCGIVMPNPPLDFRQYPLKNVSYEEAVSIVNDMVVTEFNRRFGGGFETAWDVEQVNLRIDGVQNDQFALTMYIKLEPDGDDTIVEMLALVKEVSRKPLPGQEWEKPKQLIELEEALYDAFILESLNRSKAPS